ncbi:MAG TPA: SMP-30/gluconolactonase/LRE family protein [Paracoccaceae bacterium]|nr:SMP-30/gluconolactonase/LRE family protein [Paracoccaceae bacterium]
MRGVAVLLAAALLALPARAEEWPASYPEGPVWIDGTLYWAEMGADRVMAWEGAGEPRVFFRQEGCGPTALARYREAELLVLCHRAGTLVRTDAEGRPLGTIREDAAGNRLRDPNDASADGHGGVWFTDPGIFSARAPAEGAIYHLGPDGTLTRHVTGLAYGNGIHVDSKGGRLLVSEHMARRVLSYPLRNGTLGAPEVLIDFAALGIAPPAYPEAGPDGLEIAPDGTLWVAEYGAGRLHGWREGEGLVATLPVPAPFVTNIAFGPDGLAAITAPIVNDRPPYPGRVWVMPADRLTMPGAFGP